MLFSCIHDRHHSQQSCPSLPPSAVSDQQGIHMCHTTSMQHHLSAKKEAAKFIHLFQFYAKSTIHADSLNYFRVKCGYMYIPGRTLVLPNLVSVRSNILRPLFRVFKNCASSSLIMSFTCLVINTNSIRFVFSYT